MAIEVRARKLLREHAKDWSPDDWAGEVAMLQEQIEDLKKRLMRERRDCALIVGDHASEHFQGISPKDKLRAGRHLEEIAKRILERSP